MEQKKRGPKPKVKEEVKVEEQLPKDDSELLGAPAEAPKGKKFVGYHPITKEEVYI